jgi:hypothetical protein
MKVNPYRHVENNFYCVKIEGESDPERETANLWQERSGNLITGYTAHGIERARPISGL